jgi:NAD(P)-dependent dehydrogenase (short-subunit alcohol dehydrogenase family)
MSMQTVLSLTDEVAIVTGAGQGNGAAIALGLAAAGATVACLDIDGVTAERTAQAIRDNGGAARSFVLDVTNPAACSAIVAKITEACGAVSILVNNAGVIKRASIDDDTLDSAMDFQLNVNIRGGINMVRACLPGLRETQGRVVSIGSLASFVATTGGVGYAITKGAVVTMTKALSAELAADGIRVNAIAPGLIRTPMTEYTLSKPEVAASYMSRIPLKRYGEPEDLVGPVVFLCSAASAYVTGTVLPVDGGYLAA